MPRPHGRTSDIVHAHRRTAASAVRIERRASPDGGANLEIRGRVRVAMRPGWLVVPLGAHPNGLASVEHTPAGHDDLTAVAARTCAAAACRVGAGSSLSACSCSTGW
jgi:hypothetical protein